MNNEKGFTLLEVVLVIGITILMTGFLVNRFSRVRIALDQGAASVRGILREAQANALSGALYANLARCGYGVHFNATNFISTSYVLYVGPQSGTVDCSTQNRNFDASDTIVRLITLPSGIEIVSGLNDDIFFEPPNPTTYIDGIKSPASTTISVRLVGAPCPGADCKTVTVTTGGTIQSP